MAIWLWVGYQHSQGGEYWTTLPVAKVVKSKKEEQQGTPRLNEWVMCFIPNAQCPMPNAQ